LFGTFVNTIAIIAGSLVGILLKGSISEKAGRTVIHAVGLAVILIGLKSAFQTDALLIVIVSMALGSVMGEVAQIENWLEKIGQAFEKRFSRAGKGFARGFVTASLIFCVGAMAIVGSLESGLSGNHQTLYAKSMLDGISSIILASTFGIGVMLSAAAVLLYQGAITLGASVVKPFLTPAIIGQMTSVGGLLIVAIGLNLLGIGKIKVGNMLPAIFLPLLFHVFRMIF
jgi:uncharacterized membrane protein YqgA involved in biofilm formation